MRRIDLFLFTQMESNKLTFGNNLYSILHEVMMNNQLNEGEKERKIIEYADEVGNKMAVAITNSGHMLFLHREVGGTASFSDQYSIFWALPDLPWELVSGEVQYSFQLLKYILKQWVKNIENDMELKRTAICCKEEFLSNMIVYYRENGRPTIKMISIDKNRLNEFKRQLKNR